jgi:uncharacterized membrane protein YesL
MGLFDYGYRPGRNIEKEEKKQKPHIRFLKILYSKIWELTKLNLLYLVFLLPTFLIVFLLSGIVTSGLFQDTQNGYGVIYEIFTRVTISSFFAVLWGMGPVTAGLTSVLRKYAREEHSFVWSDFWGNIKSNFKQSVIVFLIDIISFVVLYAGVIFYGNMPGMFGIIASILIISIILVYTMMHFYIYPIMVTYDMKLWHIYYNSLLFTIGKLPRTFLTLFILLAIHIGLVLIISNFAIGILFLLFGVAVIYTLSGLIVNFNVYENMREYLEK